MGDNITPLFRCIAAAGCDVNSLRTRLHRLCVGEQALGLRLLDQLHGARTTERRKDRVELCAVLVDGAGRVEV